MKKFNDIVCVPVVTTRNHVPQGGPIWPDFYQQNDVRFRRNGKPRDFLPDYAPPVVEIAENCVWGGFLERHFGHAAIDHFPRLIYSFAQNPDDRYIFTLSRKHFKLETPRHFRDLFDWIGLKSHQMITVTAPTLVRTLFVAEQPEDLGKQPPLPAYLNILEKLALSHNLEAQPDPILYVGRVGLLEKAVGGHLGEGYLAALLQKLGVTVIEPSTLSLKSQLMSYHNAKIIVFAEGSAVHGRQLLAHRPQDIHIMNRRRDARIAETSLKTRCTALRYHETIDSVFSILDKNNQPLDFLQAVTFDIEVVLNLFDSLGVPLRSIWQDSLYVQAVRQDVKIWLNAFYTQSPPPDNLIQALQDKGFL